MTQLPKSERDRLRELATQLRNATALVYATDVDKPEHLRACEREAGIAGDYREAFEPEIVLSLLDAADSLDEAVGLLRDLRFWPRQAINSRDPHDAEAAEADLKTIDAFLSRYQEGKG